MIDFTKPIQTRDGRKARIICTNRSGDRPIVALIAGELGGPEASRSYYLSGGYQTESNSGKLSGCADDLVNIAEVKVRYHTARALEGSGITLGYCAEKSYSAAYGLLTSAANSKASIPLMWDCVIKVTTADDKLTGLEIVTA